MGNCGGEKVLRHPCIAVCAEGSTIRAITFSSIPMLLIGCLAAPAASASRLHPNISSITVAPSSMYSDVPATKCQSPRALPPWCSEPGYFIHIWMIIVHFMLDRPHFNPPTFIPGVEPLCTSPVFSIHPPPLAHHPFRGALPPTLAASQPGYTIHHRMILIDAILNHPQFYHSSSFILKQAEHCAPSSVSSTMLIRPCSSADFHHCWSGL